MKKVVVLFVLVSSVNLFAQEDNSSGKKNKTSFQPKFTLGSGIYTLNGDIQREETGILKGKEGFNAGMKFDVSNNVDFSFLFIKTSFSEDIDADGIGLQLGYSVNPLFKQSKINPLLSLGLQRFSIRNAGDDFSAISVPFGFGLRMNITNRLQFDVVMNFGIGMSDIDMVKDNPDDAGNADGYKSLNFGIHYDLFTPTKDVQNYDDTYYADVNFSKLESEDGDLDLVPDMDDYCPETPIGVKVDKNGCPLDDDKDGIPNYLDQQKNTPEGSIVDANGVQLSSDKYQSMYSELEIASRKYANFYNNVEIKRENYATIDEYLIAKANAFNKAFNQSKNDNLETKGLLYKVKIGEFKDGIPAKIANRLLSLDDLESFTMDDDAVIYAVGTYSIVDDAMTRMFDMEDRGFDDTYIIVDNNGEISNYVKPVIETQTIIQDTVLVVDSNNIDEEKIKKEFKGVLTDETTYRIQIGAFKKPLSDAVFVGVNNVVSFTGKDGWIRYMTGSFSEYKNAVDYQAQMRARGFEDAFVVTYKNGKRISLNIALKKPINTELVVIENDSDESDLDLKFTVQIMVAKALVSADDLQKMSKLGNIDKKVKGSDMYEYYAGTYVSLEEANSSLEETKLAGYEDAFIIAELDGERITLERAKELLQ
ncbi:MAG: SPOR domain-containing protein [Bacteroidota bacterium]|nr:SPOR domain-containing protein [Bacteroidota bacterium]